MLTAIVCIVYAFVIVTEFIPSKKQTPMKEKVIYCTLLSASFAILFLFSIDIVVPGPSEAIKNFVGFFIPL